LSKNQPNIEDIVVVDPVDTDIDEDLFMFYDTKNEVYLDKDGCLS